MYGKKLLTALLAGTALLVSNIAAADPITGQLEFIGLATITADGSGTSVDTINFDDNPPTAPAVFYATGDFAAEGLAGGMAVSFIDPFAVAAPTSTLWSVGGFTFDLASIIQNEISGTGAVIVKGRGTINFTGYDATFGDWTFTSQGGGSNAKFSFSSTTVPEPALMAVLALGLMGVGAARSRKA